MERAEKVWLVVLSILLIGCVSFLCWKIITSRSGREIAEEHLGSGAICDPDLLCIKAGVRYECVTHAGDVACAQLGPLERP